MPFFVPSARHFGSVLLTLSLYVLTSGSLAAGACAAPRVPADTTDMPRAFETMTLSAGGSANFNRGLFDEFYHSSPGAQIAVSMPFYAGMVEVGAGLRRYEPRLNSGESFWALPLTLGWGARPRLTPRLSAEATAYLGNFLMNFESGAPGLRTESEVMMGLGAGLSFRFAEGWRLVAAGRYERVYTTPGIGIWHVSFGLRRTFQTPEWLKNFLR